MSCPTSTTPSCERGSAGCQAPSELAVLCHLIPYGGFSVYNFHSSGGRHHSSNNQYKLFPCSKSALLTKAICISEPIMPRYWSLGLTLLDVSPWQDHFLSISRWRCLPPWVISPGWQAANVFPPGGLSAFSWVLGRWYCPLGANTGKAPQHGAGPKTDVQTS